MFSCTEGATMIRERFLDNVADLRAHFVGIGGAGMSGAASLLTGLGASVSGSDLATFEGLGDLVNAGAHISIGHCEAHLDPAIDLVVISAAVPDSNLEVTAAKALGIRVVKYAQLLGEIMQSFRGVAVAGTHGKSTTTAMCSYLCRQAGLDPTFLFGARSEQLGGGSGAGLGPHFIVEACEFDRSFLSLNPSIAAILNLEADHLDCYGDFESVVEAFSQFASQVDSDGLLICSGEDEFAMKAAKEAGAGVETFGFGSEMDWRVVNLKEDCGCFRFDVWLREDHLFSSSLSIPGRHNVANALAAIALAYHAGADPQSMTKSLPGFDGIARRLDWKGQRDGVTILDDYAHHPTEIRVSLEAARRRYQPKRTWVVFQPHQRARTQQFMAQFAESLDGVDEIIIPDVYAAREGENGDGPGSSRELVSRIRRAGGHAKYVPTLEAVVDHVQRGVSCGDLVVTMGAGDVWKVADELVERISGPNDA